MHVINARNVNDAYDKGVEYLLRVGERNTSRAGDVIVAPTPVTTVYSRPWERVLFNAARDANPIFHLFESLYLLAGWNDARWLDQFVSDFSARFAEDGGVHHGSYGHRWRKHFDVEGGGNPNLPDQLNTVVELLRKNPDDRRVVISMWDPPADLGANKKDVPCNLMVIPRVRTDPYRGKALDITVPCRSNDIVWGAYGANAVQFSILQEYLAARIGVAVGYYYQVSLNFHAYISVLDKVLLGPASNGDPYAEVDRPRSWMVNNGALFNDDFERFMAWTLDFERGPGLPEFPKNPWLNLTAMPLFVAHKLWKKKERERALGVVQSATGMAWDWKLATERWYQRRLTKKEPVEYER